MERLHSKVSSSSSDKLPPSLQHGIDHEDEAADKYMEYMYNIGRPVQVEDSGFVVHPGFPHLGCSPDRKVVDPKVHPHFGIVEIKCPYSTCDLPPREAAAYSGVEFSSKIVGDKLILKDDHAHMFQIQGQLALTGAKWCDYVIYTFKGMHIQRIPFNEKMWMETIMPELDNFFLDHYANFCLSKV